jgi:hypothetical protein
MIIKSIKDLQSITTEQYKNLTESENNEVRAAIKRIAKYGELEKNIKRFEVNDLSNIKSGGDRRTIRVSGTAGAGFTLTIKDLSGCSALEEDVNDVLIPSGGIFTLTQDFPALPVKDWSHYPKEYYEITLQPHADVHLLHDVSQTITLSQCKDPEIAMGFEEKNIDGVTVQYAGDGIGKSGLANYTSNETSYFETTITNQATGGETESAAFLYVKSTSFEKATSNSNVIKKTVTRGESRPTDRTVVLKPLESGTDGTGQYPAVSDISIGMTVKGEVEIIKKVIKSLEVVSCQVKTNRFELEDVIDIFEGMHVYLDDSLVASVETIDCDKEITLNNKITIAQEGILTFKHEVGAFVEEVLTNVDGDGNSVVVLDRYAYVPDEVVLSFNGDTSSVSGVINATGSGTSVVSVKTTFSVDFGTSDARYTIDPESVITRKPNIRDHVWNLSSSDVTKGVANQILLSTGDTDANSTSKKYAITQGPAFGQAVMKTGDKHITYTANGFITGDLIRYKVIHDGSQALVDGVNVANPQSEEGVIRIVVSQSGNQQASRY